MHLYELDMYHVDLFGMVFSLCIIQFFKEAAQFFSQ